MPPVMSATLEPKNQREMMFALELRALQRMAQVLCEHVEQLIGEARSRQALGSREAQLQCEVFAERKAQAARLAETSRAEPCETRVGRYEKLVEALGCSRSYFLGRKP